MNNDDTGIEFKAALQLKAEFGISASTDDFTLPGVGSGDIPGVDFPDFGAGAMVGAFVNLVEYLANVAPEDDCALEATQELNLNMGVFAKFGINFEKEFLGLRPSATTTLLTLPLPTACILEAGLPTPTREALPPPADECSAEATASSIEDGSEDAKETGSSVEPTEAKTTAAPSTTGEPKEKRQESGDKDQTAIVCASQLADCPDDLLTTITYKSSFCAAPAQTGSCFAVSDAGALEATSVVNPAPAATPTENKARAQDVTGTGATATGAAEPVETAADDDDDLEEDSCDEESSEEDESTGEEGDNIDESTDEAGSGDAPAGSSEDSSEDDDSEDTSADGSTVVTVSEPLPTGPPNGSNATAPEPEPSDEPEPEPEPEAEEGSSGEDIAQTGSGSRLTGSVVALVAAGFAMWALV